MKAFLILFLLVFTSTTFAQSKVSFKKPKAGDIVTSPFKVEFEVTGMTVEKAGAIKPNSGHHHIIIDGKPVPKGEVIGQDANTIHFGDGQTSASVSLPSGEHMLTLQFGDGAHTSYGPEYATTIMISVADEKSKKGNK